MKQPFVISGNVTLENLKLTRGGFISNEEELGWYLLQGVE